MRYRRKKESGSIFPIKIDKLEKLLQSKFKRNPDLSFSVYEHGNKKAAVFYISYLTDSAKVEEFLLNPLLNLQKEWTIASVKNEIPLTIGNTSINKLDDILEKILLGIVFIYIEGEDSLVSYQLSKKEKRNLAKAETESVVIGPQIAFTESLETNLNVIRWSIRSPDLVMERIVLGKEAPHEMRLVYMKSVANEADVNTMRERLQSLEIDNLDDSSVLSQYIEDSSSSIFPQFYLTELPDRFAYTVTQGRVGVIVENSPTAIIGPSTFLSFFESTEDLYMRWNTGSFLRILRFLSVFLALFLTPMYVAAVTYHYEIIPSDLLVSIGQSRAGVPFPPIFEALFLELMIELLREAGARLPTKVGQTIGIVGGVVVGTAAVQAGITSNILIIFITISALASFTAPSYLMGTTIRVLRFPIIILAGLLGIVGIIFGICFLLIHLLKLTSLGRPYLAPIYPLRMKDFNKVLFRLPPNFQWRRFLSFQPKDPTRYSKPKAKKKKDIDE